MTPPLDELGAKTEVQKDPVPAKTRETRLLLIEFLSSRI